jgi:hypothetical protein
VRRAAVLLVVALLAGCGGSSSTKRISPDHATLVDVDIHNSSAAFAFDVAPDRIRSNWADRSMLAECGSGRRIRPPGSAFYVIHFWPAQSQGIPKRIVMPSGPILRADKVCDFEADVAWVLSLDTKLPADVSRDGSTVTVTFGG